MKSELLGPHTRTRLGPFFHSSTGVISIDGHRGHILKAIGVNKCISRQMVHMEWRRMSTREVEAPSMTLERDADSPLWGHTCIIQGSVRHII